MPGAEHFSPQFNLFHGSWADLEPGTHVKPHEGAAFATDDEYYASGYGQVHHVEPVDPSDLHDFYDDNAIDDETGEPYYTKYMSKSGFWVTNPSGEHHK